MDNKNLEQPKNEQAQHGEVISQNKEDLNLQNDNVGLGSENFDGSKLGKFKSIEALISAYNTLQSDYTKKCQSLSSLQKKLKDNEDSVKEETSPINKNLNDEDLQNYIFASPELKNKFFERYFSELNLPQSPKLMGEDKGSGVVLSPVSKPKTLQEAEKVVRELLNKN